MIPRVMVTGAGGPAAYTFMQAVAGNATLIAGDIDPYASGLYLAAPECRILLPRGDSPQFVDELLQRCVEQKVDVLVPTVDAELLPVAKRRDQFAAAGIRLLLASTATLTLTLDKFLLAERCAGTVRVPRTLLVDETFDANALPVPFIVKPRSGSGSRGIRLVRAVEEIADLPRDGTQIAQEYLPGPEFSIDVLGTADGRIAAAVPRSRLKTDSGVSVTGRTVQRPDLVAFGRETAELAGVTSVVNIQCKEDAAGLPALLEINPRFSGAMPLTIGAGVNMPLLSLREALGEPIPDAIPFNEIAMVRFLTETFLPVADIAALEERALAMGEGRPPALAPTRE